MDDAKMSLINLDSVNHVPEQPANDYEPETPDDLTCDLSDVNCQYMFVY